MRTPIACLAIVIAVFAWSAIAPYERSTWWMEVAPALIALPLLFATYKKFPLTTLLYVLIAHPRPFNAMEKSRAESKT
ncbi:hypothetical protein D7Y15_43625 [Corallococcus sp. AB030]|nr:hypothetical protein D7Y15_43625 [Corallococcus sp. AB030]